MRQSGTIHSIQSLRAVAASLVALFHSQQAFAGHVSPALFPQESYLFGFGAVGVHIFFVISGVIMVLTSYRPDGRFDAPGFFRRRLLRIYPIYWLCGLTYLAVHALIGIPYALSVPEALRALLLWPGDSPKVIGPAWTLTYEMYFYLCFGLAMTLSFTRGLIALAIAFLLAIGIGATVPNKGPWLSLATDTLLLEFLAGAGIGWLATAGRLPSRMGAPLTGLGVALFIGGILWGYERLPTAIIWGVPSAILILGIITWESHRGAGPAVRWLGKLGDSSYVLYLIHILLITLAVEFSFLLPYAYRPAPPVAALLVLLVALAAAEAIHRGIERPAMARLKPKRKLVRPLPEPAPPLPR